ncbi:MAG: tetratricopeptide repeat protein [Planctomycetes bacterium]|nr:tetratricopeptide repeat protein [Planctomycetota bacterium]
MTQDPAPSRLERLREMHRKDPRDSFAAYGLAMELAKRPETAAEAVEVFARLLEASPEYLPAYYQLGVLLARRGETARAREVLEKGIAIAERTGDRHTRDELQAALEAL